MKPLLVLLSVAFAQAAYTGRNTTNCIPVDGDIYQFNNLANVEETERLDLDQLRDKVVLVINVATF